MGATLIGGRALGVALRSQSLPSHHGTRRGPPVAKPPSASRHRVRIGCV